MEEVLPDRRLSALAEWSEAEAMLRLLSEAPPRLRRALRIASARMGGGIVLSMGHSAGRYASRALGLGVAEPVSRGLIDEVCGFYRSQRSPGAVLQIAPPFLPPDWDKICASHDLVPGAVWVKVACEATRCKPAATRLQVRPVGAGQAAEWASVILRGFGVPDEAGLSGMLAAAVGRGGFRAFAACDGSDMVAGAFMYLNGATAQLSVAATLPSHRGQGAQSALVALRAQAAAEAGCRWLIAEAERPADGTPNPSLDNVLRMGFTPLYDRQDWNWRPSDRGQSIDVGAEL
jgi:GNAT superfamily N-acetyltransferase